MAKRWSQQDIDFLLLNYKELEYNELGLKLGRSRDSVAHKCKSMGLTKHAWSPEEYARLEELYANEKIETLTGILGRTPDAIRHRASMLKLKKVRRKPTASDLSVFLEKTPISMYWLGFLLADGSFGKNNTLHLTLSTKDYQHIEKYAAFVKFGNEIKIRNVTTNKSENGEICTVTIGDSVLLPKIVSMYDLHSNKTHNPPDIKSYELSNELMISLAIGLIDGDGSINYLPNGQSVRCIIKCHSSWLDNLTYLRFFIHDYFNIPNKLGARINPYGASQVIFGDKICRKLLDFAKTHNIPVLERKWNKIQLPSLNTIE